MMYLVVTHVALPNHVAFTIVSVPFIGFTVGGAVKFVGEVLDPQF